MGKEGKLDLEDAKEYLAEHKIHVVFEKLAGDLLKERPQRPITFMINTLKAYSGAETVVVVLGIPGAGKSEVLKGGKVKRCLDFNQKALSGISDEQALEQIHQELLSDAGTPLFLEGFPRTIKQALELEKLVTPEAVIHLTASPSDAEQRLFKRSQFSDSDTPDTLDTIQAGFKAYQQKCVPLLEYYSARGLVHQVRNTKTLPEAVAAFDDKIAEVL